MSDKDVTTQVDYENPDDECLPLTKCVCGKTWDAWGFIISIYREGARECEQCGRRFYFRNAIKVYEAIDIDAPLPEA